MSETPTELELQPSVHPSSQPEPELGLQPPSQSDQQPKPWWRNLQWLLLVLVGFSSCAAMLGLIYYLHHHLHPEDQPAAVSPCVSAACRSASARISPSTDPFTQPCEYFTSSCGSDGRSELSGGRMRGQGIPGHPQNQKDRSERRGRDGEDRRQTEDKTLDRKTLLLQHLREVLETKDGSSSLAVEKTRRFYSSCLDTRSIETAGAEPFLSLIQKRQAPAIDWLRCLQAAFHPVSLGEEDLVLLHNLPYILQMSRIIKKWQNKHELRGSGPLHTYMVLNLLHTLMLAMDSRFSGTAKNFSLALGDTEGEVPRWRRCVLETERGFDSVLTHLLRQRTEPIQAEEMIQHVFSSFKSKLNQLQWMDQKVQQLLVKKVGSLTPRLWTSEESSEAELDLLFSEVTVGSDSFFSNYVQLLSLWQKRRNKLLVENREAADILSVSPSLLGNELLLPLGMFVPPLFHHTYPRAMNYGATGFLIAKDILHLLLPNIFSHTESVNAAADCLWTLYLNATKPAGRRASLSMAQQQELWLQFSALQVSLQAYQQSLQQRPGDSSLSGRAHTHLFLTAFSQVNCDMDPYREFMPLGPSFFITVVCSRTNQCPSTPRCSIRPQQNFPNTC
uniref:Kell metallo-endopeptidase (Kell blood group) n=1 Tax=Acanthochromis polyacanthus TaxID=80966 RepID=A0A3Q1FTL5_9TELE